MKKVDSKHEPNLKSQLLEILEVKSALSQLITKKIYIKH